MNNGFTPGTPATEELKKRLFNEACPQCERTLDGGNKYLCPVIQALRTGFLPPTETAGRPCSKKLFCESCANIAAPGKPCLAEAAAQTLTDDTSLGMYTKASCALALRQAPNNCPLGLNGLI